jgi:hypothetical protein
MELVLGGLQLVSIEVVRAPDLLDLPKELLAAIAAHLPEDDELAAALARSDLCQSCGRVSTRIGSAFNSRAKL